jgi:intracellular sulfur oxidation DsrE/DsrF family protein
LPVATKVTCRRFNPGLPWNTSGSPPPAITVLGNIQNHLDGVGGPDHVAIALVIHGQALRSFHSSFANPDLSKRVGQFSRAGLELAACGNTMKSQNVALKDLLPGFVVAERGGVVRIAELQSQRFLYLRP